MVPRMVVAVATLLALLAPNAYAAPEGGFIVSSGKYYRIIGGAALEVGDCAPLGGCPGATVESPESYRKAPVDGTYIGVPNGSRPGLIARFAGGHAFWLMDCGALESGNCTPRYELDAAGYEAYEAAHADVADGTCVRKASGSGAGTIARAAGGALIWLRDCAPMANCAGYVNVDAFAFENYGNAHPTIADGTYVRRRDGLIARAVGTALIGIGSCAQLASCPGCDPARRLRLQQLRLVAHGDRQRRVRAGDDRVRGRAVRARGRWAAALPHRLRRARWLSWSGRDRRVRLDELPERAPARGRRDRAARATLRARLQDRGGRAHLDRGPDRRDRRQRRDRRAVPGRRPAARRRRRRREPAAGLRRRPRGHPPRCARHARRRRRPGLQRRRCRLPQARPAGRRVLQHARQPHQPDVVLRPLGSGGHEADAALQRQGLPVQDHLGDAQEGQEPLLAALADEEGQAAHGGAPGAAAHPPRDGRQGDPLDDSHEQGAEAVEPLPSAGDDEGEVLLSRPGGG